MCVYDIEVHKSRSRMHVVLGLPGPHLQFANRQAVQRSSEKRKLLCMHMITQDIPFQQSSSDLCNVTAQAFVRIVISHMRWMEGGWLRGPETVRDDMK